MWYFLSIWVSFGVVLDGLKIQLAQLGRRLLKGMQLRRSNPARHLTHGTILLPYFKPNRTKLRHTQ